MGFPSPTFRVAGNLAHFGKPDGTSQREYFVIAQDKEIEVAEGIRFPAWTYNGFLPGPTLRATVGDRIIHIADGLIESQEQVTPRLRSAIAV